MNLKYPANLIKLMFNIADKKNATEAVIDFYPQKVSVTLEPSADETSLPSAQPEAKGVSGGRVRNYFEMLRHDRSMNVHSVLIAKDGYEIARFENKPYSVDNWHISYSMCKTVVGLAIGLLIDEGRLSLEDKVLKIFSKKLPLTVNIKSWSMTVRHLLTMQSGVTFNEAGAVSDDKWIGAFLSSQLLFEPGKDFLYNSMNTYMLSAIVKEITGEGLVQYLTPRLFEPMGIKRVLWEKSPEGIEKGGWGLFIMPVDMLKLGVLFQQYGKWEGKQLVSEKWITEMSSPQCAVPEALSVNKYGYQMWCRKNPSMCLMNGLFGQNVYIFRDTGIVVAATGGNSDMFHSNNFFAVTEQFWGYESRLLNDRQVVKSLKDTGDGTARFYVSEGRLRTAIGKRYPVKLMRYIGKCFDMDKKVEKKAGIMPVLIQLTSNNYTRGLKKLAFDEKDGVLHLILTEGDCVYEIPVGFGEFMYSRIDFNGELFSIATDAVVTSNEDGVPCLKIKIHYLEMASVRYVKIFFYENGITTKWTETPGEYFIDKGIGGIIDSFKTNKLFSALIEKVSTEAVFGRIKRLFTAKTDGTAGNDVSDVVFGKESSGLSDNGDEIIEEDYSEQFCDDE